VIDAAVIEGPRARPISPLPRGLQLTPLADELPALRPTLPPSTALISGMADLVLEERKVLTECANLSPGFGLWPLRGLPDTSFDEAEEGLIRCPGTLEATISCQIIRHQGPINGQDQA
jgi:hypothetical protein